MTERSQNEIAQAIIELCPNAESLVEEWFEVLSRVHGDADRRYESMRADAIYESEQKDKWKNRVSQLGRDNENLAMALRYYLRDHPDDCKCYACTISNRYEVRNV